LTLFPKANMMNYLIGDIMQQTPWRAAKDSGQTTYISAKACKHGHGHHRNTANGACTECARIAARERERIVDPAKNAVWQKTWNNSGKAYKAKMAWKARDPKNAWACSAAGGARARASKFGLACDVDKEYIRSILTDTCPVFGVQFVWYGKKLSAFSPSLDRIRPELGYVRGNVVVISQRANAIKSDATAEEIAKVLEWLRILTAP
jgi:hypothetical protein